jgi:hypothetical protein
VLALATHAELVSVGKRCGRHGTAQRFINKRLIDAAHRYAVVVRLKGGDPLLFGRAQEEIAALEAARIAYEIVPGITAAMAAAAAVGTSLSQRGTVRSIALATAACGRRRRYQRLDQRVQRCRCGCHLHGHRRSSDDCRSIDRARETGLVTRRGDRECLATQRAHRAHDARRGCIRFKHGTSPDRRFC